MLEYHVQARRIDAHGSEVSAKQATLQVDTDPSGRADAFNPAEMLLGALAACIIKGAERVLPTLGFQLRGLEVKLHAVRQDSPPKILSIDYVITVDTDEPDHRVELLHTNIRKYGTISNTLALAVPLNGTIRRK
ncbi:MAG: hypothetical protein RI910_1756 [Verrucomicrobiota bacterium]|jgi:uncharacterized OsmC-like protein